MVTFLFLYANKEKKEEWSVISLSNKIMHAITRSHCLYFTLMHLIKRLKEKALSSKQHMLLTNTKTYNQKKMLGGGKVFVYCVQEKKKRIYADIHLCGR